MSAEETAAWVLIVDDEDAIRESLASLLRREGHQVRTAENGARALDILREHAFDVVVSDIVMPTKSGVDLLSAVRATDPRTQFVLMSGMPSVSTASDAVRLDAFDYLTKPVRFRELREVLGRALERKRELDGQSAKASAAAAEIDALRSEMQERSAELDESLARYRELIESLHIAVVEIDPSTMRLTHVSGRLAQVLFGDGVDRPWTISLLDHVEADQRAEVEEKICGIAGAQTSVFAIRDRSGARRHVQCIPSGENGSDAGRFSGVLVDVTDQKRAEEERTRLAAELETARSELRRRLVENLASAEKVAPVQIRGAAERPGEALFFGESPPMRVVRELTELACAHAETVLITGETGTGKGMLAEWIHKGSDRRDGSFVAVNCSSLRGDLLSAELFGHARGAFTSAAKDRRGLIEEADGGTLFLDEIGEMDLEAQARLLKVLEDKSFRRVGETRERKSDFRLLCATNRDLGAMASEGRFRLDLLYRINVLSIRMPSLRERPEDLPALCDILLASLGTGTSTLSDEALEALKAHAWLGNVRELRNVLIRALLLAPGPVIERSSLVLEDHRDPGTPHRPVPRASAPPPPLSVPPAPDERGAIVRALERFDGNKAKAARFLRMSRSSLYRKLERYGIG